MAYIDLDCESSPDRHYSIFPLDHQSYCQYCQYNLNEQKLELVQRQDMQQF